MSSISVMKKVLFLNLTAFSQTGGLEKFNRCFLKALAETETATNYISESYSMYDTVADERYYNVNKYRGFNKHKLQFVISGVVKAFKSDLIILGHINLALIGFIIRLFAPSKKIVLICHGIEVWEPLSYIKRTVLHGANRVLAVSSYTKQQITDLHKVASDKITVFHNTIDPYFPMPDTFNKNHNLLKRYGLSQNDFILYTLCRLSSKEQYKGYDYVIKALPALLKKYTNIKYLVAGKYDEVELNRIKALISETGVSDHVIFAGFVDDSELIAHYQLGDVYIMPSQREGFGIVFIEAMACGRRVIAGNKDGSVDALANGALGKLVDPTSVEEITTAVENYYLNAEAGNEQASAALQKQVIKHFGFSIYKDKLKQVIPTL